MATPVAGYNIAFKIGGSTLAGRTQDDLTIAARTKDSITKDDAGETQSSITGHDITFRATGLVDVTGGTGKIDRDDIIEDALKTGSSAVIAFTYETASGKTLSGNCIITNYSESSNSEDDATYTVDFKTTGAVTFAAAGQNL
jgi:predicted secreted protein